MKRAFPRNRYLLAPSLVVAALSAMIACATSDNASSDDDKDAQREKAREFYVTRVHPQAGSCVGCHAGSQGPRFMAEDAEASYNAIERSAGLIAAPKISPLVQYVHKDAAIVISADQRSVLTQWLSLEATARGLEGAVEKPKSVQDAYQLFSDCMNFNVWSYYRMGDLAFSQTDFDGPCMGCHSRGQGSAWLSATSSETFEKSRQFPFIQKLVVGKLNAAGSFEELQPSKRFASKADEICAPDAPTCHPRFGLPPNIRDMIDNFVSTTLQNLATGTCNNGIVVPASDAGVRDAGGG
jgi:hypothetical protein